MSAQAPSAVRLSTLSLLGLVAAACAVEPEPEPVPTPEEIAGGLLPAVVLEGEEPATYDLAERLEYFNVPGVSVAVMDGGEIVFAHGWGLADVDEGIPVTRETLFQAASISKPVAALTAMTLVEAGDLGLDTPVNEHLTTWRVPENEFTADSAVTLRGIMNHTAGLTVWGFPGYRKDQPFGDRVLASNVQVLDGLGNTEAVRVYKVPGTSWQYSGGGYTVMEQMVEDATGQSFPEVAASRVLSPAGMLRSTYEQPLPEWRWDQAAHGYRGDGSEVEGEWHNYPEQAAAGLWTTPTDLLRLAAHLKGIREGTISDGIVSAAVLEDMFTPHRSDEEGFNDYGLGFGIEGEGEAVTFGHGGANEGFRARWTVYRDRGQGVAIMTNGDRGGQLATEVMRSVATAFDWPTFQPEVRSWKSLSAEELAAYVGEFQVVGADFFVSFAAGEGTLTISIPTEGDYELIASGEVEDQFFDVTGPQEFDFVRDESGAVTGFFLDGQVEARRVER